MAWSCVRGGGFFPDASEWVEYPCAFLPVMRSFAGSLLVCALLAGCLQPLGPPASGCAGDGSAPGSEPVPSLVLQGIEGIWRLDHRDGSYEVAAARLHDRAPLGVRASAGTVYAAWDDGLVRYDAALRPVAERHGTFGGLAVHDGVVWVGGVGSLLAFDASLAPLGEHAFRSGTHKVSHDVMVCAPYAFLLDNVVTPVFLYQVDLGDPQRPRTLAEEAFECVCHLQAQWIDREEHAWYVLESHGGHGFSGQRLHSYRIGGDRTGSVDTFAAHGWEPGAPSWGWRVLAVAPSEPPIAVAWKDGRHWLGLPRVVAGNLSLAAAVDLGAPASTFSAGYAALDVQGDRAAVVVADRLWVVALGDAWRPLHDEPLPVAASRPHVAIVR